MGRMHDGFAAADALDAGLSALRWVADAAVAADGGATWPSTRAAGAPLTDDLYWGTAGVLAAFAEARLSGSTEFDEHARAAAGRLRTLRSADATSMIAVSEPESEPGPLDLGLYTGLSGCAAALSSWASVSRDGESGCAASEIVAGICRVARTGQRVSVWRDLICGEAGIILALAQIGDASARPAISLIADRLVAEARW